MILNRWFTPEHRTAWLCAAAGAVFGALVFVVVLSRQSTFSLPIDRGFSAGGSGLYPTEGTHLWTAPRATIPLLGIDRRGNWSCEVRLLTFCPDPARYPQVEFTVDGERVAVVQAAGEEKLVVVPIRASPGRAGAVLGVTCSPAFEPGGADTRKLGVAITGFRVQCTGAWLGQFHVSDLAAVLLLCASLGAGIGLLLPRWPIAAAVTIISAILVYARYATHWSPFEHAAGAPPLSGSLLAALLVFVTALSLARLVRASDIPSLAPQSFAWRLSSRWMMPYVTVAFAAGAALVVALQYGRPFLLDVGSGEDRYIRGWRSDDENVVEGGRLRYYRWALDGGTVALPVTFRGSDLDVRMHVITLPGRLSVTANTAVMLERNSEGSSGWSTLQSVVPANVAARGPLTLGFAFAPRGAESLALGVDWIEVRRASAGWVIPSPGVIAAVLAAALFLLAAARRLARRGAAAWILVAGIGSSAAGLLFWKMPTLTILVRMWPLLLAVWLFSLAAPRLLVRGSIGTTFLLGLLAHGVIYFHPYLYPPDLHYHFRFAEKLTQMSIPEIYRASVMYDIRGDLSLNYPYSPVFHLIAGRLSPAGADLKYVQKLVVLVAFGLAGLGLIAVARGLGFGALPLALYFSDPTLLRHLYRCHMPGMFGICITAAFMLLLARRPLTGFPLWKRVGITLLLAFAMCTYPASFLQLSVFCGLFTLIVLADHRLRTERAAMVLATGIAVALALIFFYGHYLELFWKFFQGSRGQAVATSGHAPSVAGVLNAWYQSVLLEKYWPFYLPGGIGMVLLIRRARDARWRAFQMAWVLAFVVQIVLTCDYLLPSVRGHIKEMAFLSPLFVLWESEAISWWLARGRTPLRLAAALFVLLLGALSLAKLMEMIRLGFVT